MAAAKGKVNDPKQLLRFSWDKAPVNKEQLKNMPRKIDYEAFKKVLENG